MQHGEFTHCNKTIISTVCVKMLQKKRKKLPRLIEWQRRRRGLVESEAGKKWERRRERVNGLRQSLSSGKRGERRWRRSLFFRCSMRRPGRGSSVGGVASGVLREVSVGLGFYFYYRGFLLLFDLTYSGRVEFNRVVEIQAKSSSPVRAHPIHRTHICPFSESRRFQIRIRSLPCKQGLD